MVAPRLFIFRKKYDHYGLITCTMFIENIELFAKLKNFLVNWRFLPLFSHVKFDHHAYLVHRDYLVFQNV